MCTRAKLRCFPARSQALDIASSAVIAVTANNRDRSPYRPSPSSHLASEVGGVGDGGTVGVSL